MNNRHRYNNQTSRWCDANAVPYQRNGFLFGPKEIQDQITNQTMYHVDLTNTEAKASELFEKDDWVIAQYAQGYIRCQISDFSPRAGNLIVDRYYNDQFINVVPENPIWYIDSEIENTHENLNNEEIRVGVSQTNDLHTTDSSIQTQVESQQAATFEERNSLVVERSWVMEEVLRIEALEGH